MSTCTEAFAVPITRSVPVRFHFPGAHRVVLTGDFTGWATDRVPLRQGSAGEWYATLCLPPGEYEYRLLVDGVWQDDPQAARHAENPYGGTNCVLVVE